jgi:hypothetical protein
MWGPVALRGTPELRRRLKAIKTVFKPVGREWTEKTTAEAKRRLASSVDTGRTRASVRRRNASMTKASVVGNYPVNFIDAGVKAHDIKPRNATVLKFESGGQTIFAKKVHKRAIPARPFKKASGEAGLRQVDILRDLIDLWNRAA